MEIFFLSFRITLYILARKDPYHHDQSWDLPKLHETKIQLFQKSLWESGLFKYRKYIVLVTNPVPHLPCVQLALSCWIFLLLLRRAYDLMITLEEAAAAERMWKRMFFGVKKASCMRWKMYAIPLFVRWQKNIDFWIMGNRCVVFFGFYFFLTIWTEARKKRKNSRIRQCSPTRKFLCFFFSFLLWRHTLLFPLPDKT